MKVIGYGYDNVTSLEFWIVANSWGADWGENGTFRFARGYGGIEDNFWSIDADYVKKNSS